MNKVAILTQPLHINYGGTLQAYALQRIVKELGSKDVVTLNYQGRERGAILFILSILKSYLLKRKEKFAFLPSERAIREIHHRNFIEKYIKRSIQISNESELRQHFKESDYDAVIVGSDQVWRIEYSPNIDNFFLNFIDKPIKKIAYAASFGLDSWQFSPQKTEKIKTWLTNFDAISVREDSAVELCEKFLKISVKHVIDPTMLLTTEKYSELVEELPVQGSGIFSYILDQTNEKGKILDRVSEKLAYPIFTKQPKQLYKTRFFVREIDDYVYPSIEEWIAAFRDASYIVTDSFHGTVFSIIFGKPFIAIANNERGKARFSSLLNMFGLQHRLVENLEDVTDDLLSSVINYEKLNKTLNFEREKALKFLKHTFK